MLSFGDSGLLDWELWKACKDPQGGEQRAYITLQLSGPTYTTYPSYTMLLFFNKVTHTRFEKAVSPALFSFLCWPGLSPLHSIFSLFLRDVLPFTLKLPEAIASARTSADLEEVAKLGAGLFSNLNIYLGNKNAIGGICELIASWRWETEEDVSWFHCSRKQHDLDKNTIDKGNNHASWGKWLLFI